MDNLTTMTLADDMALSQEKIINDQQDLNTKRIYNEINSLDILAVSYTHLTLPTKA